MGSNLAKYNIGNQYLDIRCRELSENCKQAAAELEPLPYDKVSVDRDRNWLAAPDSRHKIREADFHIISPAALVA